MASPRNKSISTKVTDEEYVRFEALAGEQTISEWARDALLKTAEPSTVDQAIVAELLALRMILLNVLFSVANHEPITEEEMQNIIRHADARKLAKGLERLTNRTTEPQGE